MEIADKLSAAVAEALHQPEVAKRLADVGLEPVDSTRLDMSQFMKRESERWGSVIRTTGMKAD